MLLALSVLDFLWSSKDGNWNEERSVTIQPKQNLLLFHEQLALRTEQEKWGSDEPKVLCLDSRYRYEKGEAGQLCGWRIPSRYSYGSIVVLTNPTSKKKLRLLLHLQWLNAPGRPVPPQHSGHSWSRIHPNRKFVLFHRLESLDSIRPVLHRMENQSYPPL